VFTQAFFAIELYNVTWNFGRLEFKDVKIVFPPFHLLGLLIANSNLYCFLFLCSN
jgi:hypothetical protein